MKRFVPVSIKRWIRRRLVMKPPFGRVRWGSLRRTTPISRQWGYDRGSPVDRYYIEAFLKAHAEDITGRVLEVEDSTYTRRFGADRVAQSDVLHVSGNAHSTITGDLSVTGTLPSGAFDCLILTQVLHLIYDIRGAIANGYDALKPGGVMLATLPSMSQACRSDYDTADWPDFWRCTSTAARRLVEDACAGSESMVVARGNVLSATAFLYGVAAEELRREELDVDDPDYELLITVRVRKPSLSA